MEARVLNNSNTENIYIVFRSSEDANIPESSNASLISPNSTVQKPVSSATMNLFVWTDLSSPPMWSGVVPTKVQKVIVVSPETNDVSYDGVTLPSGFSSITDPEELYTGDTYPQFNKYMYAMWLVLILIVIAIIYFFWLRK